MAYRSIVAVASGEESDARLFDAAAQLAARCGAQVRVLPAFPDPAADLISFGTAIKGASAAISERVREGERTQQQRLLTRLGESAARAGIASQPGAAAAIYAEARALMPAAAIAEASVLADLVMFAGAAARDGGPLAGAYAETLLQGRAPTLLVKDTEISVAAIAIAWDGSAEAGRAVRAALPLLGLADEVVILQNVSDLKPRSDTAKPEALTRYLAQHGVKRVRSAGLEGDNVAGSLLRGAMEARCGMLVSGAYGRPRLYELALGGTTRALVNATEPLYLFLKH